MRDAPQPRRGRRGGARLGLAPYALGALHALLLLLAVVALLHALGASEALADVGSLAGIGIGAWLAFLSWSATAWALHGREIDSTSRRDLLSRAAVGGFAAGAAFLPGIFLAVALALRVFEPAAVLVLAFGSVFGGLVGSIVGVALAGVDVGLHALARRATRAAGRPRV